MRALHPEWHEAAAGPGPDLGEHAEFLAAFARAPFATGAIAPSSRALADRMIERLELGTARTVVDAGAGTGAFTGAILEACAPNAAVVAVELNAAFAARLERRYPRVEVVHDSVERLPDILARLGRPKADVIVCGLPWAILDAATQSRLLAGIAGALKDGGHFATFGYVHCGALPGCRRFRRLLDQEFVAFETSPVVWLNLPPAVVYRCRRQSRTAFSVLRQEDR